MKNKSYLSGLQISNTRSLYFLIAIFIPLVGCSQNLPDNNLIGETKPIPNNAIQVKKDLYYVPIGTDKNGCTQYQLFSQLQSTMTAIAYRDSQGNFVSSSKLINCQ